MGVRPRALSWMRPRPQMPEQSRPWQVWQLGTDDAVGIMKVKFTCAETMSHSRVENADDIATRSDELRAVGSLDEYSCEGWAERP